MEEAWFSVVDLYVKHQYTWDAAEEIEIIQNYELDVSDEEENSDSDLDFL